MELNADPVVALREFAAQMGVKIKLDFWSHEERSLLEDIRRAIVLTTGDTLCDASQRFASLTTMLVQNECWINKRVHFCANAWALHAIAYGHLVVPKQQIPKLKDFSLETGRILGGR